MTTLTGCKSIQQLAAEATAEMAQLSLREFGYQPVDEQEFVLVTVYCEAELTSLYQM